MVIFYIVVLFILSLVLVKSADWVVVAIRRLSESTKMGAFAISAIILALGTSFPELFVGITSALSGSPNLILGVVLGANIANISLVAGIAALITGRVHVQGSFVRRDVGIALLAGLLPLFLLLDRNLSRVDGLILLTTYAGYASSFFRKRYLQVAREQREEGFIYRFFQKFNHVSAAKRRELGRLFVGLALLLFSSDMIVRISDGIALALNVPLLVIGLVFLAIGTTLPELTFSIKSLSEDQPGMFFGNILGSIIANSTFVVGLAAVIAPMEIVARRQYLVASVAFLVSYCLFWYFIRTKRTLERWEAGVMLFLYTVFVVVEFI